MAAVAFLEQRLDTRITQGAQGGPSVVGRMKTYLPGGRLHQSFNSTMPIHKYDISHGVRSRDDFQVVLDAFYVVMFTPYLGLRMKDPRDYRATRTNTKLSPLGGGSWQLQRRHFFGGIEFLRDIRKPCAVPAVTVYDATGAALPATVDVTTGIAMVTGTPATWSGEFDVPVTFTDDDWMADLEIATESQAWVTSNAIKLEEVRL